MTTLLVLEQERSLNMAPENKYNLLDEAWIPVAYNGLVSLDEVFRNKNFKRLGGTPIEKSALLKLLLAIVQSACTPKDMDGWLELNVDRISVTCLDYLEKHRDCFFLYGEKPFLQVPAACVAKKQSFAALLPEVSTGNASCVTEIQQTKTIYDSDIALLIVVQMGFAFAGKKPDNSVILTKGYTGKTKTENGKKPKARSGASGPSLGFMGMLHNFILGSTILETLWLNLISEEDVKNFVKGVDEIGISPIERMPTGEDDEIARNLKNSLMGRLLPVSRFCLLGEGQVYYTEGIAHPGYADGACDPSVAVNFNDAKPKVIWSDPERQPWRQLTSLLGFMSQTTSNQFDCANLKIGFSRARLRVEKFGILCLGMKISSNAGEQYLRGSDDVVESEIFLDSAIVGENWYAELTVEMQDLEKLAKQLYGSTLSFYKKQNYDGKNRAASATNLFWQLSERHFDELVVGCGDAEKKAAIRKKFGSVALRAFDESCPKDTARQIDAWASSRLNISSYLKIGR